VPQGVTPSRWGALARRITGRRAAALAAAWAVVGGAYLWTRVYGTPDAFRAAYWTNSEWSGAPALTRTEGSIRADGDDLRRLLGDSPGTSAVWSGVLFAPRDGTYDFTVTSDDGSWVILDGATVIDNGGRHGARTRSATLRLRRGEHRLEVRYFDAGGLAVIRFSWRADGLLGRALPPGVVYPAQPEPGRPPADWALAVVEVVLGAVLLLLTAAVLARGLVWLRERRELDATLAAVLFAALLGALALQIAARRSTSVTACDSYAYLQGAVAMAAHGPLHSELRDPLVPQVVAGFRTRPAGRDLAFLLSPHGHYVHDFAGGISANVFPPGLMWLLLPAVHAGGPALALLFLPVLTPAFMLAFFLAVRRHEGPWLALCAAAFVAWNPVVFENTVLLMSDVPSLVLTAASTFLVFLNLERPRPALPAAAGACFGVALAVRYSNAAAIVPVLALFAIQWWRRRNLGEVVRDAAVFGVAGAVAGLLPLALYTHAQFGTAFHLTYDPYTASRMQLAHFLPNLEFYARSVVHTFGVAGVVVSVFGAAVCIARRERRLLALTGVLTLAAFLLPYAFERLREHRYLMPVYPWLALFYGYGALAVGNALRRWRALQTLAVAALAVAPLLHSWSRIPNGTVHRDRTCRELAARVEPGAVVFCDDLSGPVRLYANLTGYRFIWTRFEVLAETCDTLARLGRPVYFLLDCDAAREQFALLRAKGVLPPDHLADAGAVDGLALWRYVAGR